MNPMMDNRIEPSFDINDEGTVTLSEVISHSGKSLVEEELYALCLECCLTLEYVYSTPELFQSLIITPDTVAFDQEGNVCFLDLEDGE